MLRKIFTIMMATAPLISSLPARAEVQSEIVGGETARSGEFPFIASLHNRDGHFCGGTLVRRDWVLTAAHCVEEGAPHAIYIGLHDQRKRTRAEMFRPSQVIMHPRYNKFSQDFDYALIRLSGKAKAAPAPLQTTDLGSGPVKLTVAGWGVLREQGTTIPRYLQKVSVPLATRASCEEAYPEQITDRMLCAGYPGGGKDACQGDSGGPLLTSSGRSRTLVGVVSTGEGCARPGKYGIYAKVSTIYDWIVQQTGR